MKAVIFGSTGMVGRGVLRESILSKDVESVKTVARASTGEKSNKLFEIIHNDFEDFSKIQDKLKDIDVCFYCLGVSSAGMNETEYERITYTITIAAAEVLLMNNPGIVFVFVSGAGTDSSEKGGVMWARIKGKTENKLLSMPFKNTYMFRPAMIQPLNGIKSRTFSYRLMYTLLYPLLPLLRLLFPGYVTTTSEVGLAMLRVAREGYDKKILENSDIHQIATEHNKYE